MNVVVQMVFYNLGIQFQNCKFKAQVQCRKGIQFWNKMTQTEGGFVVYDGDITQKRSIGIVAVPLQELKLIEEEN